MEKAQGAPVSVAGMAHHRPEEEDDTSSPPVEELVRHGGASTCPSAEEEEKSRRPLSSSATSCLLPARSLRSIPAAQAQSRSLSFSKLLSFRLPSSSLSTFDRLDDAAASNDYPSIHLAPEEEEEEKLKRICRSQSVPTSVRRFNAKAAGLLRRVGPAAAAGFRVHVVSDDDPEGGVAGGKEEAEEEDMVAAEEAVCRICMVALSDTEGGGALLKLECCCKGELALAHSGCAVKWFSIKGNGACDVCGQEVVNLPVTIVHSHHPSSTQADQAAATQASAADQAAIAATSSSHRYSRVWHGTPILVIISMLAYFCFLEQLLVGDHGTAALAISLPFACVLGLFSSLTTTKMVSRRYVWIYSAVQFMFIVLFTNLFYKYVPMQAVIAIILSTFAGFSVTICSNSVLLQILRWRARRVEEPGGGHGEPPMPMVDIEIPQPLP